MSIVQVISSIGAPFKYDLLARGSFFIFKYSLDAFKEWKRDLGHFDNGNQINTVVINKKENSGYSHYATLSLTAYYSYITESYQFKYSVTPLENTRALISHSDYESDLIFPVKIDKHEIDISIITPAWDG